MTPPVHVTEAGWRTEQAAIRAIRHRVFVREQHVPEELEEDGEDGACWHVLGYHADSKAAVATGRLLPSGQIGRMAVLAAYRGSGLGGAMLQQLLTIAEREGVAPVWLSAQQHAIPFYERHGFTCEGPVYDEAGIPHRKMSCVRGG